MFGGVVARFPALVCILFSFAHLASSALNQAEWDAFLEIFNATKGPTGNWLTPYNYPDDPCTYMKVHCDASQTTITALLLAHNDLVGTLPDAIGSFPNAERVLFGSNQLEGTIPASIVNLKSVAMLDFAWNNFTGPVPEALGSLFTLTTLMLSNNQLTSLPDLSNLLKLTSVQADGNLFTGTVPTMTTLLNLRTLILSRNNFSGTIPEIPQGSHIETLIIGDNSITGTIPQSFENADYLINFMAQYNKLTGTLPPGLTMLNKLELLYLNNNRLSGDLPAFARNYKFISLDYNQFTGPIPSSFFNFEPSASVFVSINHLNGTVPPQLANFPGFNLSCNDFVNPPAYCARCGPCELCGDGFCDTLGGENCATCPQDCGPVPCGVCGDGFCDSSVNETCSSCRADCGTCPIKLPCPGVPECTGRGVCLPSHICSCFTGFTGPACESVVVPVTVVTGTNNPTTTITSSSKAFQVNIKAITEYDFNGQVVAKVNLTALPLTLNQSDSVDANNASYHNWTYQGSIPNGDNTQATITVNILLFHNATNITFGNETFALDPMTTKYTLSVKGWEFMSAKNHLGVSFAADSKGNDVCVQSQKDSSGSVQWFKMLLPTGDALYAMFIQQVKLDDKYVYANLVAPENGTVELQVPHFWDELVFDPNFSMLVNLKEDANGCFDDDPKTFGVSDKVIILVVIFGTLGVFLIIVGAMFIHKKVKMARQIGKARLEDTPSSSSASGGLIRF